VGTGKKDIREGVGYGKLEGKIPEKFSTTPPPKNGGKELGVIRKPD